jgi:hypothetical protein
MTRVFLNDAEVAGLPEGLLSLGEVIRHIEVVSLPRDTVIRQIHLDGSPVIRATETETAACLKASLTGQEKVEIFTGSIREVSSESIREAIDYLSRVEAVIPSMGSSFQALPTGETYALLRQMYDGFYWISLLVERLRSAFGCALLDSAGAGPEIEELSSAFRVVLRRLVQAQEKGDLIMISDTLEYELLPLVPKWRAVLEALATAVGHDG